MRERYSFFYEVHFLRTDSCWPSLYLLRDSLLICSHIFLSWFPNTRMNIGTMQSLPGCWHHPTAEKQLLAAGLLANGFKTLRCTFSRSVYLKIFDLMSKHTQCLKIMETTESSAHRPGWQELSDTICIVFPLWLNGKLEAGCIDCMCGRVRNRQEQERQQGRRVWGDCPHSPGNRLLEQNLFFALKAV